MQMASSRWRSQCFRTPPGWGLQGTGHNQHHSSPAWGAPYKTRHTHAKIRKWPTLRENHRCSRSQRVGVEYRESRWEGEAQMRWQAGSKGKPEHWMQSVCKEETLQILECLLCQRLMFRMSQILAQEKQIKERAKGLRRKRVSFQVCGVVHIQNI